MLDEWVSQLFDNDSKYYNKKRLSFHLGYRLSQNIEGSLFVIVYRH